MDRHDRCCGIPDRGGVPESTERGAGWWRGITFFFSLNFRGRMHRDEGEGWRKRWASSGRAMKAVGGKHAATVHSPRAMPFLVVRFLTLARSGRSAVHSIAREGDLLADGDQSKITDRNNLHDSGTMSLPSVASGQRGRASCPEPQGSGSITVPVRIVNYRQGIRQPNSTRPLIGWSPPLMKRGDGCLLLT